MDFTLMAIEKPTEYLIWEIPIIPHRQHGNLEPISDFRNETDESWVGVLLFGEIYVIKQTSPFEPIIINRVIVSSF